MWLAVACVVAMAALGSSTTALSDPSPTSGPTAGGTTVSDVAPTLRFTSLASNTVGETGVAIAEDGNVYTWGQNRIAASPSVLWVPTLVDFSATDAALPILSVSTSGSASLAVDSDGTVWAWGVGAGVGPNAASSGTTYPPVEVPLPGGATASAVANSTAGSAYALGTDGDVYAWGTNVRGQLGGGVIGGAPNPNPALVDFADASVESALPIQQIFGTDSGAVYALGADGGAYAWGNNASGQLGNNARVAAINAVNPAACTVGAGSVCSLPVPVDLPASAGAITQVSGTLNVGLALDENGQLFGWGGGANQELGDASSTSNRAPMQLTFPSDPSAPTTFTAVTGGSRAVYAVAPDGKLYAWGNVSSPGTPIMGNGAGSSPTPVLVSLQANSNFDSSPALPVPVLDYPNTSITAYNNNAWVLGADGAIYAWGSANQGQFGSNLTCSDDFPVLVLCGPQGQAPIGFGVPWPATPPSAQVTGVTFGGAAGTSLTQAADTRYLNYNGYQFPYSLRDAWGTQTPPGCGVVEVVVTYLLSGEQRTATYPDGFTYGTEPAITSAPLPDADLGVGGGQYTASVTATGDDVPAVAWEFSTDDGLSWTAVDAGDVHTAPAPGGITSTLSTEVTQTAQLRAIATNCWSSLAEGAVTATSNIATVTVAAPPAVHTVYFDPNGGTGTMTAHSADAPTALTPNTFTRAGWVFAGWNTAPDGSGTAYADMAVFPFADDATLYAQWQESEDPGGSGGDGGSAGDGGSGGSSGGNGGSAGDGGSGGSAGGGLALTGTVVLPAVAVAALSVIIGGLLMASSRRRSPDRADGPVSRH